MKVDLFDVIVSPPREGRGFIALIFTDEGRQRCTERQIERIQQYWGAPILATVDHHGVQLILPCDQKQREQLCAEMSRLTRVVARITHLRVNNIGPKPDTPLPPAGSKMDIRV